MRRKDGEQGGGEREEVRKEGVPALGARPWRLYSRVMRLPPDWARPPREAHCTSTFVNHFSETSALLFCSVRPAPGCGPRSDPRAAGPAVTIHNRGWNKSTGPAPGSAGEATEAQGGRELKLRRAGVQREGQSVGPSRGGLA